MPKITGLAATPPSPPFVKLEHVTFRGPAGPVFPDSTLSIGLGERWAIVGPNGSGKGLFVAGLMGKLGLLAGRLAHPFLEGDPRFADSVFGVLPPGSLASASMREHRAWLLARDFHQLRWHGSLAGGTATVRALLERTSVEGQNPFAVLDGAGDQAYAEAREREIRRCELVGLLDRPVAALSNGELHRFVLARALLRRPRLLFLEDPVAGLDQHSRERLVAILDELDGEGIGVVVATEREQELPAGISHVARVAAQRLVEVAPRAATAPSPAVAPEAPRFAELVRGAARRPPPGPIAELRHVTVRHGQVVLLDDISWEIAQGERWALLGPNGSGKSTLLSLLLADNPQVYANEVRVAGRALGPGRSIWDQKAWLGWVSPELESYTPSEATALEVVASGFTASLGVHGHLAADRIAAAQRCLHALGLQGRDEHRFGQLAPEARRRVLLGRAMVHGPALLLLDEPCQGLDPAGTASLLAAIAAVVESLSAALVYVTHDLGEIPASVDHCLVLDRGRTAYLGPRT